MQWAQAMVSDNTALGHYSRQRQQTIEQVLTDSERVVER